MKKIVFFCLLILSSLVFTSLSYGSDNYLRDGLKKHGTEIKKSSIDESSSTSFSQGIEKKGLSFLFSIKVVISGVLVVYLVYSGIMMVISMGRDEGQLSEAKRSVRYAVLALFFINIPGTLYSAFTSSKGKQASVGQNMTKDGFIKEVGGESNLFYNDIIFIDKFNSIVYFLSWIIAGIAVISIVFSGLRIITAQGESEKVSSAKQRILWSMAGLVFLGFMQLWIYVVYTGDFTKKGQDLYSSMINLVIFFGVPIAMFFISMAGYYYVTAGGDEDRIKKAKNILLNVLLAIVILLGIYTLLNDLSLLNF